MTLFEFESFRTFKCPLFPKPASWLGLFLPFLRANRFQVCGYASTVFLCYTMFHKCDHANQKKLHKGTTHLASFFRWQRDSQKYSRLRCLLRVKGLVFCFYLGWSGPSSVQTKYNKGRFKVMAIYLQQYITLSLPSYTVSALQSNLPKT